MCYKSAIQIQHVLFLLFVAAIASASRVHNIEKRSTKCILPPYPDNGFYEVAGDPAAKPGDDTEYAYLNVSCHDGNSVIGNNVILCIQGEWSTTMPQCVPVCHLQQHPSVTYSCKRPGAEGFGACSESEPQGTSVKPECRAGYKSQAAMPLMRCVDQIWTYVAQCTSECGRLSDDASTLPWYVYIYRKMLNEYKPTCGATIISPKIVISAAHCFWDETSSTIRTTGYIAVAGKTYLHTARDDEKYSVSEVKCPERFRGSLTNYQEDIALVILSRAFKYSPQLQPVCLDFDYSFQKKQMQEGNMGTVGVFPFPMVDQALLQVQKLPYMPAGKCIEQAPPSFREYITGDKFCAGRANGTLICRGNSGSGLAFPEYQHGVIRYYLRGVISTAPHTDAECAPSDFVALTEINKHEHFIKEHL